METDTHAVEAAVEKTQVVSVQKSFGEADDGPIATRAIGYAAITIFVLLFYVLTVGHYQSFVDHVLPTGDPFTYTVDWFRLIDAVNLDPLSTLIGIFDGHFGGWYRLMYLELAALSPILGKNPPLLCIVNLLTWGLAAAAYFRLGTTMKLGVGRAFVVALVPWIWPVDYGFEDYSSIQVLALDAAFTGALALALASSFVFAFNPRSPLSGIIAALSIGAAVWGRGNSAPIVAIVVGWPSLLAIWVAWKSGERRAKRNVALAALLALAFTFDFYLTYAGPLMEYYSVHAELATRHTWNFHDAVLWLKNIPGFMYWRSQDSWLTIGLSWVSHAVPLLAILAAWRGNRIAADRRWACCQLAAAGALIYFVMYFANLAIWTDPLFSLTNSLYIWRPMLIGMSLSAIVLFLHFTDPLRIERDLRLVPLAGVTILLWGVVWNAVYTPWYLGYRRPQPGVVERFALAADQYFNDKEPLSFLWYGNWNAPIVQYYRLKDDYPELPLFVDAHYFSIWSSADYSPENRAIALNEVKATFLHAGMVIIAEYLDDYAAGPPYAFYHFKEDWADWLNSPDAPKLRVRMILKESPTVRLLVVQREELAHGRGDPFRLPWGNRPATPPPDYSDAVVRVTW